MTALLHAVETVIILGLFAVVALLFTTWVLPPIPFDEDRDNQRTDRWN